tara:strand:- start:303 stop:635 length:333 start_codon:yes stop_codon:yes gene_type:complete
MAAFEYDGYYPVFDNIQAAKDASSDGTIFIVRDNKNNRDLYVALIDDTNKEIKLNTESKHIQNETKNMTDTRVNSYNETIINENSVGNIETTKSETTYTVYHHTRPNVFC